MERKITSSMTLDLKRDTKNDTFTFASQLGGWLFIVPEGVQTKSGFMYQLLYFHASCCLLVCSSLSVLHHLSVG